MSFSGADKYKNAEVEKSHNDGERVEPHFTESKVRKSNRISVTSSGSDVPERVKYGAEADDDLRSSTFNQKRLKKNVMENLPKVDEEDDKTRERPTNWMAGGYNMFRILANSIFGEVSLEDEPREQEAEELCPAETTINYRFRFEDEDPEPVEKTEFELELEALFTEMDFALQCEEMGSFETQTVSFYSLTWCIRYT